MLYERACRDKRLDVSDLLRRVRVWQFKNWIRNDVLGTGHFRLKPPRGMRLEDIRFEHVALGIPWWKPGEELDAELKAISAGLMDPQTVCKAHGFGDYEDNVRATIKAMKFAEDEGEKAGVVFTPIFAPPVPPIQVVNNAD